MNAHKVTALVKFNVMNELPREFWAHEIPVLQNLANGHPVTVVGPVDGSEVTRTPRDVLVELRKKYGQRTAVSGGNVIDEVYPDGSRDIEAFYKGEYIPPVAFDEEDEAMADVEVLTPEMARAKPETTEKIPVDREVIISRLQALGVPFSSNTPTKHLAALLESSVESGAEGTE